MLAEWPDGLRAVVKVERSRLPTGKTAQREISASTHPQREVAYYETAKLFGFDDVVPETVLFDVGGRAASAQAWAAAEPFGALHEGMQARKASEWLQGFFEAASQIPKLQWLKLFFLDFLSGARDRHANNVGVQVVLGENGAKRSLVVWDNAVCFGTTMRYYHSVFHKHLFRDAVALDPIWRSVSSVTTADLRALLLGFLPPVQAEHACIRKDFFEAFPHRLPWSRLSKGRDDPSSFPAYEDLFRAVFKKLAEKNQILV